MTAADYPPSGLPADSADARPTAPGRHCADCGAALVVVDAPILVPDPRGNERWLAANVGYCPSGHATLVDVPLVSIPIPGAGSPPGEAETPEGRACLAAIRASVRDAPADSARRREVAITWRALSPYGRIDAARALTREEQEWLALASGN